MTFVGLRRVRVCRLPMKDGLTETIGNRETVLRFSMSCVPPPSTRQSEEFVVHVIKALFLTMLSIRHISIQACVLCLALALHSCAPSSQILVISTQQTDLAGNAQLRGVVNDFRTGDSLIAFITFENLREEHNRQVATVSNIDGKFIMSSIPPGNYSLLVSRIGYESLRHSGLVLARDHIVTVQYRIKETVIEPIEVY